MNAQDCIITGELSSSPRLSSTSSSGTYGTPLSSPTPSPLHLSSEWSLPPLNEPTPLSPAGFPSQNLRPRPVKPVKRLYYIRRPKKTNQNKKTKKSSLKVSKKELDKYLSSVFNCRVLLKRLSATKAHRRSPPRTIDISSDDDETAAQVQCKPLDLSITKKNRKRAFSENDVNVLKSKKRRTTDRF